MTSADRSDHDDRIRALEMALTRAQTLISEAVLEIAKNTRIQTEHMERTLDLIEGLSIKVSELERWRSEVLSASGGVRENDATVLEIVYRGILTSFNADELDEVMYMLEVPSGEIPGTTLSAKARSLIRYMYRRGKLGELVHELEEQRPNYIWPIIGH